MRWEEKKNEKKREEEKSVEENGEEKCEVLRDLIDMLMKRWLKY